ncbi:MAG: Crp/Fnr family transcriptional regulator [Alloprevotella sp.]|nr:Crp/Fnr family transcriptional regulator [Alloprevotella sp.]
MENLTERLAEVPAFRGCSADSIRGLLAAVPYRTRRKAAGAHIAHRGEACVDLIVLLEGEIYTSMVHRDGREVVVHSLSAPEVLAPAFLFAAGGCFPVNVVARTECRLLYISRDNFAEWLHRDRRMMMNFIGILSDRCERLSQRVKDFALQSLKERVTEYLRLHRRIDNVQWLARVLGVARPSLSRVLSELKSEGIIERTLEGLELKI